MHRQIAFGNILLMCRVTVIREIHSYEMTESNVLFVYVYNAIHIYNNKKQIKYNMSRFAKNAIDITEDLYL